MSEVQVKKNGPASSPIPNNSQNLLSFDGNKAQLFSFLNVKMRERASTEQTLTLTGVERVICVCQREISYIAPSNQVEAESKIMLEIGDALRKNTQLLVCSVDTNIVVLSEATIEQIQASELKLWIAFGTVHGQRS